MFAAIFPGQGSQSIGMMHELYNESEIVRKTISEAASILGFDLWELMQNGPNEKLNDTLYTQPAMLVAGVASWRYYISEATNIPTIMAGHSLGEYTALVCSGALTFQDAIDLVKCRAQYMAAAVPEGSGAMAAIMGLNDEAVIKACDEAKNYGVVEAVNFNAPGQVVVAGSKVAVENTVRHEVAEGDGPVNALDAALRKALASIFPHLHTMHLLDYKVRVINAQEGTAARVRVSIQSTDGDRVWGTVGVSENVIEASWLALADSFHFFLTVDSEVRSSGALPHPSVKS